MGCAGSRFDEMPVTGHPKGLALLPGSKERFLRPEHTVLRLHEKLWSWSGDDFSVQVRLFELKQRYASSKWHPY